MALAPEAAWQGLSAFLFCRSLEQSTEFVHWDQGFGSLSGPNSCVSAEKEGRKRKGKVTSPTFSRTKISKKCRAACYSSFWYPWSLNYYSQRLSCWTSCCLPHWFDKTIRLLHRHWWGRHVSDNNLLVAPVTWTTRNLCACCLQTPSYRDGGSPWFRREVTSMVLTYF